MQAAASSSSSAVAEDLDLSAFNVWRRSMAMLTGLGLSEEEAKIKEQQKEASKAAAECKRCEAWRDTVVAQSPIVRFMLEHVNSLPAPSYTPLPNASVSTAPQSSLASASTTPSTSALPTSAAPSAAQTNSPVPIYCMPCGSDRGGGFAPNLGVILCQDRVFSKSHVEDTLAHELIHEWDHRRFKVDWSDLKMVACSEIRAASLSGDCRWGRELRRRNFGFTKQHQECTRRRAALSVTQHGALASEPDFAKRKETADRLVNEVWESCWNDTRPFDEIY